MERPNLPSNQFPPLLMEVSLESCGLLGDLGGTGGGAPRPPLPVWGRSLRTAGKMQVEVGCCSSWQSSSELLEGSLSALGVIMGEPLANPQIASKMQPSQHDIHPDKSTNKASKENFISLWNTHFIYWTIVWQSLFNNDLRQDFDIIDFSTEFFFSNNKPPQLFPCWQHYIHHW